MRNHFELVDLFHEVKHVHGSPVSRVELVFDGHHGAHGVFQIFVRRCLIAEPDGVEVVRIFNVAQGGEGDVEDAVNIVVACLHLGA